MSQDILITPGSGEPQILFRGSGTTDTAVELNVLSSYQSATGSGTSLLFEGEEGLLFGITDNLSSGTIFSVSDISGLTAIEYDASGDLKLGEYANSTTLYTDQGVYLVSGIPTNTNNAVYISGSALHFNGGEVGGYDDAAISGYFESRVSSADSDISTVSGLLYDDAAISGYFESRVDATDTEITAVSGYAEDYTDSNLLQAIGVSGVEVSSAGSSAYFSAGSLSGYFESRVDSADTNITANSGYFESRVDTNAADIVTVSGLTGGGGGGSYTAGSGLILVGTEFNTAGTGNFDQLLFTNENLEIGTDSYSINSGISIGYQAGYNSTVSYQEVNVPLAASYSTEYFGNLISIGNKAARGSSFGNSTLIGFGAGADSYLYSSGTLLDGYIANSGFRNVLAIGTNAFSGVYYQSTGLNISNYIAIGEKSCSETNNSRDLIGIGQSSCVDAIDLSSSIGIGVTALRAGSGNYNIGIGQDTLSNCSGDYNIGIGHSANWKTIGSNNIEINTEGVTSFIGANSNKIHIEHIIAGDTSSKLLAIGNVTSSDLTPDATLEIKPNAATDVGLIVQAATSQSATLQEWQNSSETKLLAVGPDGGLELPNNAPSTTTNKLYNDAGTLKFNGSQVKSTDGEIGNALNNMIQSTTTISHLWDSTAEELYFNVGGLATSHFAASTIVTESEGISSNDNDTTIPTSAAVKDYVDNNAGGSSYTAGSGLTLTGTEFNVYGGSGNFEQIDLTTDATVVPKMVFTGSGVTDTSIRMKVLSSHASASTSGTALAFEGTEGQLFGITDNLSSGTIFSVNDITGLPLISADASGDVNLAEFGRDLIAHKPITLNSGVPSPTTDKLYNDGYKLNYDGAVLPKSEPVAGASGIHNMMVMSQATYDALSTKDPNTLYYIV